MAGAPVVIHGGIIAAAGDVDFHDQARHAADEIPGAAFLELQEVDHLGVDTADVDPILSAVRRTLGDPASQVS